MTDQYTRMGKQILTEDGEHFADGASEAAAVIVLEALNSAARSYAQESCPATLSERLCLQVIRPPAID